MKCLVNLFGNTFRHLSDRVASFYVFNQLQQDPLLIVGLAEKLSINPVSQSQVENENDNRRRYQKQIKVDRIAKEQFRKRTIAMPDDLEEEPH